MTTSQTESLAARLWDFLQAKARYAGLEVVDRMECENAILFHLRNESNTRMWTVTVGDPDDGMESDG